MTADSQIQELEAVLARAVACHRAGRLDEAAAGYAQILNTVPRHARTLHLLGRVRLSQRRIDDAIELLREAADLEPADFRYQLVLGDALQRQARFEEALASYRTALDLAPDNPELLAKLDTIEFLRAHMAQLTPMGSRADLLAAALDDANSDGLVLEFGVAEGKSLAFLASRAGQIVYGFDSFEGLPEAWRPGFGAGAFAQRTAPANLPQNAELVVGRFEDTLPPFVAVHPEPIRFLHVDCDLYASTACVFQHLGDRLYGGSVIVFDEFLNYAAWREHEHRAFVEMVQRTGVRFEYLGYVAGGMQAAVRITGR